MPFDPEEFGIDYPVENEEAGQVPGYLQADNTMHEAEKRMEKAVYYKALLQDTFFDDNNITAREVETEVKAFVRSRFNTLLGIANKPPEETLTADEIRTLKMIVVSLLAKSKNEERPVKVATPKEVAPAVVAVTPKPKPVQPVGPPKVKRKRVSKAQAGEQVVQQETPSPTPTVSTAKPKVGIDGQVRPVGQQPKVSANPLAESAYLASQSKRINNVRDE